MLLSMRRFAGLGLLLALGCARPAAPAEGPKSAPEPDPEVSKNPGARFSEHCEYKLSKDRDTTLIACSKREVLIILPGGEWKADDGAGVRGGLLFAESVPLRISVVEAEAGESKYPVGEHLTATYDGIAAVVTRQGLTVSKPHVEEMPNGHLVLAYEMSGTLEGVAFRSVNVWTALRRMNGHYYDYHVSFTQAADDQAWQDAEGVLRLTKKIADAFFVTDGHGNAPPQ